MSAMRLAAADSAAHAIGWSATPGRLAIILAAAGVLAACGERGAATIKVDADPFLFNGSQPVALPARVLSADGRTLAVPLVGESDAEHIVRTSGGAMQCLQPGDATITLSAGRLRARLRVHCRPVVSFGPPMASAEFIVGGAPAEIPVRAYGPDGALVPSLRFSARSSDTSVAVVRDGRIVPRSLGAVRIDLDFGGIGTVVSAEVVEPVVSDTIVLAAGEYRSWPLAPGRYRISAHGSDGRPAPTGVELRSSRANCARDPRQRETLHCVVAERGAVVALASRALTTVVRIVRRPR